jgi:hypothetical protein
VNAADQFARIFRNAISQAQRVKCPPEVYADGLGDWVDALEEEINAVLESQEEYWDEEA